jgi:hypothetical protein
MQEIWDEVTAEVATYGLVGLYEDNTEQFFNLVGARDDGSLVNLSYDGGEEWLIGTYFDEEARERAEFDSITYADATTAARLFVREVTEG